MSEPTRNGRSSSTVEHIRTAPWRLRTLVAMANGVTAMAAFFAVSFAVSVAASANLGRPSKAVLLLFGGLAAVSGWRWSRRALAGHTASWPLRRDGAAVCAFLVLAAGVVVAGKCFLAYDECFKYLDLQSRIILAMSSILFAALAAGAGMLGGLMLAVQGRLIVRLFIRIPGRGADYQGKP